MQPPSLGDTPSALVCAECGVESDATARGWRAYLALEEDGSESCEIFCRTSAEEAFGDA